MECPECHASAPDDSRFCPHCGARIDRVASQPATTAPAAKPARVRPARSQQVRRGSPVAFVFSLLGCVVIAGACLMPWALVGGIELRGLDLSEGPSILTIAIVAGALAIYGLVSRRRWLRILIAVGAAAVLALGTIRAIDIYRTAQSWGANPLDLLAPAFFALLGGGLLAFIAAVSRSRRG